MKLQDLKTLSEKELIRMRALYEGAGLTTNQMASKLHRMTGTLSEQENISLEERAIEIIGDIVSTLNIPKEKVAHYLDIEIEYDREQRIKECRVEALAFIDYETVKFNLFLNQDKFSAKNAVMNGAPFEYHEPRQAYKIINTRRCRLTSRGKAFVKAFDEALEKGDELNRYQAE